MLCPWSFNNLFLTLHFSETVSEVELLDCRVYLVGFFFFLTIYVAQTGLELVIEEESGELRSTRKTEAGSYRGASSGIVPCTPHTQLEHCTLLQIANCWQRQDGWGEGKRVWGWQSLENPIKCPGDPESPGRPPVLGPPPPPWLQPSALITFMVFILVCLRLCFSTPLS